ncbi:MAG TPA: phosphopantetheine-binding protein [Nitrospiraceae bacterium]|jgi:acyl carrier protein|nr:phosphopantetheine-binding protein [Nitrospiraceae bacterium]
MAGPLQRELNADEALEHEVMALILEALHLDVSIDEVDPTAPLFSEGLGLDSIDMLEIALTVSKKYGFDLRSEDRSAFGSFRALSAHVAMHRTK